MTTEEPKRCITGQFTDSSLGVLAFVPDPLPPHLELTTELVGELSQADQAVGRLDGIGRNLPNPHLLIRPFMRREAVLSSRIEGTQSELRDLMLFEASEQKEETTPDVREVQNYVIALEHALEELATMPLSLRVLRNAHRILMSNVRGQNQEPGAFRKIQNWIGAKGMSVEQARYVPPPPQALPDCLSEMEKFINTKPRSTTYPALIRAAMVHYQFEAIHPFIDGNGRLGRLLIVLMMQQEELLHAPLLYLSAYFERRRQEYYDRLLAVSKQGDWAGWIHFFLKGVTLQATDAALRARRLLDLQTEFNQRLKAPRASALLPQLVELLFSSPILTNQLVARRLEISREAARRNIQNLAKAGIVVEMTRRDRNRRYYCHEIIDALDS